MSRRPIVAGNWKMNTTLEEAVELARALRASIADFDGVDRVVCPPFVWLAAVSAELRGSPIDVGAQNLHWEPKGAFTGEVAPAMVAQLARYVILGHSERRQYFGETDETVNRRVKAALAHDLRPIVCVGETHAENQSGATRDVVTSQTRAALVDVPPTADLVVAYEPVWAIGTGLAATAAGANETIGVIRSAVSDLWGAEAAAALRVQYGGSVTAANAAELFAQPEIDGALVGGASLKAFDFTAIVQAAGI
jgi:triosephosphate isomerase